MQEEIWKDIQGYEGRYQISNLGNVKSLNYRNSKRSQNLVPKVNNYGYKWVELSNGIERKQLLIHRLVALAFIDNPLNYPIINHKDENPLNCTADNLEWCTNKYNVEYSMERHPERFITVKTSKRFERAKRDFYKLKTKYSNTHINQFSLKGEFIKQWLNFAELKHIKNYNSTSIKECCEGKRKTAYGYKWEFADDSVDSLFI